MTEPSNSPEEYLDTSETIRTGEYFRESLHIYDALIHDSMAERYFYVLITAMSCLIMLVAGIGMKGLYPMQHSIPFIVDAEDLVEDVPRIKSLLEKKGEDPSKALIKFILGNYVTLREEYRIDNLDRNVSGVKAQSVPEVFAEYQAYIQPTNPNSPIALYERHSVKKIIILATTILPQGNEYGAEVLYEAIIESKDGIKKSRWQANIAFNYSGIGIDEDTGKITSLSFIVTKYNNKLLQDIK